MVDTPFLMETVPVGLQNTENSQIVDEEERRGEDAH